MSSSAPNFTGDGLPLRSVLKQDDESERPSSQNTATSIKAVQIAEPEPELEDTFPKRQFSAGIARRLSGRSPVPEFNSSRSSLLSQNGIEPSSSQIGNPSVHHQQEGGRSHSHRSHHQVDRFVAQVVDWLDRERVKKDNRGSRRIHSRRNRSTKDEPDRSDTQQQPERHRAYSIDSQSSDVSLDRLQKIIDDGMTNLGLHGIPHYSPKLGKKSQRRRSVTMHRTVSSDTEYHDGSVVVPTCDAVLDNSKTLGYSGGKPSSTDDLATLLSKKAEKERKAWISFKNEIIKLAHTLKFRGWRRVSLDSGESIDVTRLSGALTNAVYVVSPPDDLVIKGEGSKRTPPKLLLRIYGPQASHIIDRQNELLVLRRLAKKKIGPRLLGTFTNGRFEQYLNAEPLTAVELKDPDTSRQIAKRMRELHDGIELLDKEIDGGPMVLKNWDTWINRVSRVATYLDRKVLTTSASPARGPADAWRLRGFVCGVEWVTFKRIVDRYREFLNDHYGGPHVIREHLVFAHSDTQYGNILRVKPDDKKSPLLQPNYEHKQLVVIDFEYSGANTRGLEFANHFTEWCYNYHDEAAPHACDTANYPTPEEQRRFIKVYVNHRPEFPHPGASTPNLTPLATPTLQPQPSTPGLSASSLGSTSSIKEFMLDSRAPPGGWKEEERRRESEAEAQIEALMEETRIWRVANSAQWVAWGLMQTNIPGIEKDTSVAGGESQQGADGAAQPAGQEEEESEADEEFDYLGYAQERAFFFLGDCIKMGLLSEDELPEQVRGKIKYVDY
ncbi:kinase-like protein [Annulohypoxylon maeteangense]|uniref:kinase-like protein n=1 Tax=Annulohypoxylon maeteangense TaxID=1927788 RepID=UPI002008D1AF|nr:kinase-like protein [Annulohypoxylon maeteangense]KAI0886145.1 kinase-like protein [Annulohypoxylon maeteangense]